MVTLRNAFQLCNIGDEEIVYLYAGKQSSFMTPIMATGKEVRQKCDMRSTKVTKISPHFICGEYEGFAFTIQQKQA